MNHKFHTKVTIWKQQGSLFNFMVTENHSKIQIKHKLQTIKEDIFNIQALFGLLKLNEHTPFIKPTKCTFLISMNIK
jgi:hypothetical protein